MTIDDMQNMVDVLAMHPRTVEEAIDPAYRPIVRLAVKDVGQLARVAAMYERDVDHQIEDGVHRRVVTLALDVLDLEFFCDEPVNPVGPVLDFLNGLVAS